MEIPQIHFIASDDDVRSVKTPYPMGDMSYLSMVFGYQNKNTPAWCVLYLESHLIKLSKSLAMVN